MSIDKFGLYSQSVSIHEACRPVNLLVALQMPIVAMTIDNTSNVSTAMALEHELAFLVRCMEAMRRYFHVRMERAHYLLLSLLEQQDRQSVGALANQVNLDASTVTRQVAAMKKAGLVVKHDNPDDRRGGFVALTQKGRDSAQQVRQKRMELVEEIFKDWSESECRDFAHLVSRFNEHLHAMMLADDTDK